MPTIEARSRLAIADFLPGAIQTALDSYQFFSGDQAKSQEETSAKQFKEHHDACKVAIAHIELLIKLARWADLPDPKIESQNHQKLLQNLIEKGQAELAGEGDL